MNGSVKLAIVIVSLIGLIIAYLIVSEIQLRKTIESSSRLYAYYATPDIKYPAFIGEDNECMLRIEDYYEAIKKKAEARYPVCAIAAPPPNSVVYDLGEKKGNFVKVAYLKKRRVGAEKIIIGYVHAEALHLESFE